MRSSTAFTRFAKWTSRAMGASGAFAIATVIILVWVLAGPFFQFGQAWQLTVNTATTIVTFLMVFLIQNTQNRESVAVHIKLDELIRAVQGAHNALLDLEELTQDDLDRIKTRYEDLARIAREELRKGHKDTGRPDLKPESRER